MNANEILTSYQLALCDLNGIWRGKRFPESMLPKVLNGEARLPASILACDIWGQDLAYNQHLAETGDGDSVCVPTGRGPLVCRWLNDPTMFIPVWMANEDRTPFMGDPRRELEAVVNRYKEHNLTAVTAIELEFYLVKLSDGCPTPICSPQTGRKFDTDTILSLDELDQLESFFCEVYTACSELKIPAETTSSENGPGQFEINLKHCNDPLKTADDAVLLKRVVRGVARKHGFIATFMAKPYGQHSGSSMHVHFSLADHDGLNAFDNNAHKGSEILHYAIGGLLKHMQETLLLYAPHLNSYRRHQRNSLAPIHISWGHENRTTAIRIPGGSNSSRRIEHRLAGADANPYLVLAALLGSALLGIEKKTQPGKPIKGYAYEKDVPRLKIDWQQAITDFSESSAVAQIFSKTLIDMLTTCKQYELDEFRRAISRYEYNTYLDIV